MVGLAKRSHGDYGGGKQKNANAKGHGELEGERAQQLEKMRKRNCCTRGESLFKEDSPARAPRHHRKSRPTRTKVTQPMTRGPGPTSHIARVRSLSIEKAKRHARSELLSAVVRLFISVENKRSNL
jgi:hypothetical protein